MAIIQYSALVTQIKGKMQGGVFQSGAGGNIVRSAKKWDRQASLPLNKARYNAALVARAWQTLSATNQMAWLAAAANYPGALRMGGTRKRTGYQIYSMANIAIVNAGGSIVTAPIAPQGLTSEAGFGFYTLNTSTFIITIPNALTGTEKLIIEATPTLRAGRQAARGIWKRIIVSGYTGGLHINLRPEYLAVFGNVLQGGQVWIRLSVINMQTGQISPPVVAFGIVA